MVFHVTLEGAEDGWLVAECPALPGCVSQGKVEKEALENIKRDALQAAVGKQLGADFDWYQGAVLAYHLALAEERLPLSQFFEAERLPQSAPGYVVA